MTSDKLYKVEQSEKGHPRVPLCRPTTHERAKEHLHNVIENLVANEWRWTDKGIDKRLATAAVLTNGERTIALSVVECSTDEITFAQKRLAEMQWLTRFVHVGRVGDTVSESTTDYDVDPDRTPSEWIADELREGVDEFFVESVGV